MKSIGKVSQGILAFVCLFSFLSLIVLKPSQVLGAVNAKFDVNKMSDMSDFDPNNPKPVTGDTIKIAVVAPFSGPAAHIGQFFYFCALWPAHDINKRGGLLVDGKKKLIEVIKADTMGKLDQTKKICERMALQEKVHVLYGTSSSNLMKVINEVANKYKIIAQSAGNNADELYDATNFSRYSFMTAFSTEQVGHAFAYYYGQIKKKEKKFYILCADYVAGHDQAEGFKRGLKKYFPEAQIVGEDYHKLFLTDFAPYLTKIKASGAEVIFTNDFPPDASNLLKQARQMGIKLPFAHLYMNNPRFLVEVGVEGTQGLVEISQYSTETPFFKTPEQIKFHKTWNNLWKTKWKAPYNVETFEFPAGNYANYLMSAYWLLSVIERAQSTDPEKIIKIWEGDSYQFVNDKVVKMRPCDHKVVQDLYAVEFVPPNQQKVSFNIPPYHWFNDCSFYGPSFKVPAKKILPLIDKNMDRCKGKEDWSE